MPLVPDPKNCDISVKRAIQGLSKKLGYTATPVHIGLTLTGGPFDLTGKTTVGSQTSPVDVTTTRKYGFELHYSGNNYDVTGIRSRAQLVTTDTTATALGGLFQAANNDGIDAGVLMGFMAEAIGKSTANASTITTMRGGLIGTEWGALDTITNLKTLHIRGHSLNAAGAGSFGTGYALYIENEAVGGNGQAYDAGIYFKGTNLSAGNKAFTYGIDFTGSTYGTSQINLIADGSITMAGTQVIKFDDTNFGIVLGTDAFVNGIGKFNIGIGYKAGENVDSSGAIGLGDNNIFIGYYAGRGAIGSTSSENIAIGFTSMQSVTTGMRNVAIGTATLRDLTEGNSNFALGQSALANNIDGSSNVGIGRNAMLYGTSPDNCIAIGGAALFYNLAGGKNVAIGYNAGLGVLNQSHEKNTFIGYRSGFGISTGSSNIFLGNDSGFRQTTNSDLLIIDNQDRTNVAGELANSLIYGVFAAAAADQSLRINGEILGSDGAKIGDGGTTNYTDFASDGLQTMAGTARVIRELWVDAGGIKAPGSKPATAVTHGLLETPAWSFSNEAVQANEQTISFNLKVPPDMDRSVAPTLCLGWSSTTTTGVVEWQLEYLYSQAGETTAAAAEETLYADDSVSGTAEGLVISIVSGINLPHANDVCIHCRVKRLSSAVANGGAESDTLADSAEVHGVVFTYTSDKLGTTT